MAVVAGFLPVRPVLSQRGVVFLILEQLHWEGGSYWLLMPRKKSKKNEDRNSTPGAYLSLKYISDDIANRHRVIG